MGHLQRAGAISGADASMDSATATPATRESCGRSRGVTQGPENEGRVGVAGRRHEHPSPAAPSARLEACPDHAPGSGAGPLPSRWRCHWYSSPRHDRPGERAEAAWRSLTRRAHAGDKGWRRHSGALSRRGSENRKKPTVTTAVTAITGTRSRPTGRSNASAGSSKYMSLTILM